MYKRYALPVDDALADVARRAFPSYRGRKFDAAITDHPVDTASYWSGGSRSYYVVLHGSGSLAVPENGSGFVPVAQLPDMPAPGYLLVEHTIFQGKDLGLTVWLHSDDASILALPTVELTATERAVLEITKTLISRARQDEARYRGISRAEWLETQEALKSRGLLAKKGSITVDGRNAIA